MHWYVDAGLHESLPAFFEGEVNDPESTTKGCDSNFNRRYASEEGIKVSLSPIVNKNNLKRERDAGMMRTGRTFGNGRIRGICGDERQENRVFSSDLDVSFVGTNRALDTIILFKKR